MDDVTQYFMDMTLEVPSTEQVVRIPERWHHFPTHAHISELERLVRHYNRCAKEWKYAARQYYEQYGYQTDMFGVDPNAGPSNTCQDATFTPGPSHPPAED